MRRTISTFILLLPSASFAAGFADLAVSAGALSGRTFSPPPAEALALPGAEGADKNFNKWYGADSRQARLRFETWMLYKVPAGYTGAVSRILDDAGQREKIEELVRLQLRHMYGAFTMHPGFTDNPGVPSGDYKLRLVRAEKVANEPYAWIGYTYDDTVVFSAKIFPGGGAQPIRFALPTDPATIYRSGFPRPGARKNLCTDEHYNSEGDFWYFWNPYQEGCPITEDELILVETDLEPLPMTRGTYPEYDRLYGDNGNGPELKVTYLVGIDESFHSGDLGRGTFRDAFALLKAAGFEVSADENRRKSLYFRRGSARTVIDMRLMDPDSAEFAAAAAEAMRSSDIFLYDGHSGLGGYLDPERLAADSGAPLALPRDKYQIFVFQGCSTYAYYNANYFRLKRGPGDPKGTKNLDIVTTGIGAAFEVGAKADAAFLTSVTMGNRPSWQTIINRIHAAEGDMTALTHVNGDEDNPTAP
ncbi:MAG: hypothetical protein FD189_1783 [Elusimicrobia bacterium]|nr:MAG: hypothetical protein FD154_1926 [Elusimicrobiota bacterium]KAF0154599.1 MAG: hypothetical protein FD189_1783 [Elusimicrobiota bacterium]